MNIKRLTIAMGLGLLALVFIMSLTILYTYAGPIAGEVLANSPVSLSASNVLTWTTRASMSAVRTFPGATGANNGKIYVIGGWNSGPLASVEEYDPATDTWRMRASMPTARIDHSVVMANNGKIYAISGDDGNPSAFTANEEYDPTTNTWTVRAGIPTPRYAFGLAAANNGKLYAIGGANYGNWLAIVEEYDPATDTWVTRASMSGARAAFGVATASNGKIYVIGGTVPGHTVVATVEEYDPATDTWRTRTSMPTARVHLRVVAASNGKLYAIGGLDSSLATALAIVEEYDPATDTWQVNTSMPTARYGFGIALGNNGKIYAIGGERASQQHLAIVEEASFLSSQSLTLSINPPPTADVGDLVYIPVSLSDVVTSDDVRGVQLSIRVSNLTAFAPAGDQPLHMGDLFPADSLTYTVAVTDGWDFMLTAPFSPTPPISGTGIIVELPFYAQAEGCVDLTFTNHILTNSNAITISHQTTTGQICLIDQGHLVGATYLQSRASGYYADTLVLLEGSRGTYTTTTDATGNFTITDIDSGVYTATFTHPLFVNAIRQDIIITGQMTTTLSEVGLWAGDMNQDGDVDKPDWYVCAAASIPVDDPAFDINGDNVTNIIDCTLVGSNIGRPNMSTTNPPKTGLMVSAQSIDNLSQGNGVSNIVTVQLGNGNMLLRAIDVSGQLYATGARLGLPVGATVTSVELRDGFAGGFLRWHQDNDSLYIIAAPHEDNVLTRDTDIVSIHITGGNEVVIEAANSVGVRTTHLIFLPIVARMQN